MAGPEDMREAGTGGLGDRWQPGCEGLTGFGRGGILLQV